MLVPKTLLVNDKTFVLAKITGVQNSIIRGSSKVLRIISLPIPFKSPIEIPTIIFSDFFTILLLFIANFVSKFRKNNSDMFTGIIETLGRVTNIEKEQDNLHITVSSEITNELKIDQSVAHNGICLTVVAINDNQYTVTAIRETIEKTNIGTWKISDIV